MREDTTSTYYRVRYESRRIRLRDSLFVLYSPVVEGEYRMPERTNYFALAPRYVLVDEWCRRNGVSPRSVRYIVDMSSLRGTGDFSLIIFGGWQDNDVHNYMQIGDFAMSKAQQMYFPDTHKPIVREGVITGWERR